MIGFAHTENLFWLALVPVCVAMLFLYVQWRKNALNRLVNTNLRKLVFPASGQNKSIFYGLYICAALVFLISSLGNLQAGKKPQKAVRAGLDIVLAIDVSKSMDAQDMKPSRMAQTKHFAQQLLDILPQDRVALVLFAANAYIQLPLTNDISSAKMFINTINTDIAPTQGTSVTNAIAQSLTLLFPQSPKNQTNTTKVIVLLSDGENHETGAEKEVEKAVKAGANIYTIGIGTPQGAAIPLKINGNTTLQKDQNNQTVISKLNELFLKEIAAEGKGKYYNLAGNNNTAKDLAAAFNKLKRTEREVLVFEEYESYFQIFAGLALVFLLLEPLETVFRKKKINT